jgi:two-component system nitrogen regulation response regulator GlnG
MTSHKLPTQQALSQAVADQLELYFERHGDDLPPAGLYDRILALVERPLIERCLKACDGNQIKAAHLLGLNRNTLRKKMNELGMPLPRPAKAPPNLHNNRKAA